MKSIIFSCLSFLWTGLLFAQNPKSDFSKISANLMGTELLVNSEYRVYDSHLSTKALEVTYGVLKQKGALLYQQIEDLQALTNEKITLNIDTVDHLMVVSDPIKKHSLNKKNSVLDLDTFLLDYQKIEFSMISATRGKYSLVLKDGVAEDYSKYELYFDTKTFLPEKVVIFYDYPMDLQDNPEGEQELAPRLEIVFTSIVLNPGFNVSDFDEGRFLVIKGDKLIASSNYKNFRIIDNRYSLRATTNQ